MLNSLVNGAKRVNELLLNGQSEFEILLQMKNMILTNKLTPTPRILQAHQMSSSPPSGLNRGRKGHDMDEADL